LEDLSVFYNRPENDFFYHLLNSRFQVNPIFVPHHEINEKYLTSKFFKNKSEIQEYFLFLSKLDKNYFKSNINFNLYAYFSHPGIITTKIKFSDLHSLFNA